MRQIFDAIAEYDRSMIVAKLRGARQRMKAREGRCEGRKPYGTFEGERETMARMHELRAAGLSFDAIAVALNQEGIKPRYEGQWQGRVINRILIRTKAA